MKKISILILFCALFCFGLLKIQLVAQNPPTENAQNEKQTETQQTKEKTPDGAPPALDWVEKNGKFYLKTQSGEIEAAPLSTAPLPKMDESDYAIQSLNYRKVYILGAALRKMSKEEYQKLAPDFSSRYPIGGLAIRKLTKGFRADDANIRTDDIIIGFDRYQMSTMDHLQYFSKHKPKHDTKIKLWILRVDKLYYVDVPVEAMDVKPQDGGFVTTDGPLGTSGFTHLVTFKPKGNFNPQNANQFLFPFLNDDKILKEGPMAGYFRTKNVDGKLVGSLCTDDPDAMKRFIDTVPQIEFVKSERLTKESFEAYEKTKPEILSPTSPKDGGFVTDGRPGVSGFTHLVTFRPKSDFNPKNAPQFLLVFRDELIRKGPVTGYFRTTNVNGKLVGSLCTGDPDELKRFIETVPEIEFVKSERLTKESFEAYEKTPQESIPPTDGGFATPEGGFTHLIIYGPKGDFVPRTPMDYLSLINPELWKTPIHIGYFRTKIEDGKLIAMNLTSNPDEYRKVVESIPKFQYISTERLTKESFEAYENTQQVSLPPEDGGYATDAGYTHIVSFAPQGDFAPKAPQELLGVITFAKMNEYATQLGYFRTKPVDGKLIGSFLTSTPDKFEKLVDSIPNVKFLSSERLTKEKFEAYEKTPQESLTDPELKERLDEIQKTAWFQKLNEKQKRWYLNFYRAFPFAFDPKNYEVGNDRAGFEKKWVERLEGPEPGFPGRSQLSPYDEAIFGLATIKSEKAAKLLTKIACEQVVKDNAHRSFAVRALGMLGDASVVPDLIPLLYHWNTDCRWESQIALVRLTGENFGGDEHAWLEWYNANRGKLGQNLPKLDSTPVDWTCGSSDSELKKWADREEQKKRDAR